MFQVRMLIKGNKITEGEEMDSYKPTEISEINREELIEILTDELPSLRAKLGISQDELSSIIGVSRQTYSAVEGRKRKMSWNTFLSLILFYGYNEKTQKYLEASGAFPPSLKNLLNVDKRAKERK